MRSSSFFVFLLVLSATVRAELPDLGQGLAYLRIHSVAKSAAELNAALLRPAALVLDLRYTADEPAAADLLRQELGSPAPKPRLFVLVSPATPVPVVGVVAANSARLITLGIKDARPAPQVIVDQTAAADRAAYAALESGTPLALLVAGRIEKERFDEAALVKEFMTGFPSEHSRDAGRANDLGPAPAGIRVPGQNPASQQPGMTPATRPPEASPGRGQETAAPATDRVLQRALHLHRALQALKR